MTAINPLSPNPWIICDDCGGTGRDEAGHNFANTGSSFACENCDGQGGWEEEIEPLTSCSGDPFLKHTRRVA